MVSSNEDFGVYQASAFVGLDIPPRKPLMGNWLVESSITLIYADAGVGKTNFALGLAIALAKGEDFLDYSNAAQTPVMFFDGEMPAYELQRRLKALSGGLPPDGLMLCSSSIAKTPMDSLASEDGQYIAEKLLEQPQNHPKVIIIDNKSTLMAVKRENDADSWIECQNWLIRLRNEGYAVVLVHHAGKSGAQRGSSMTEVTPDIILKLAKAGGAPEDNCSRFVVQFDKNRHLMGKELTPKLVTLRMAENSATWEVQATIDKQATAKRLSDEGLSQRDIAARLGCSVGAVNGYINT